ncbi:MAG TPA: FAD-dependent oxidoreductase [Alphaproteobacteria bacterium]|nr:FAD-dependent oxidoreductase [Alphaproteobacteria bacterium]
MTGSRKRVGVIGAGIVGIATASYLQRDGHEVFVVDPDPPGRGASFGNAGCFNSSSIVPMAMPGTLRKVPGWLRDPLGPLAIRWRYLPTLAPWLIRFIRAGTPGRVEAQARALAGLLGPCLEALAPLVKEAGAQDLVRRLGHLVVYRSDGALAKDHAALELRRRNGITWETLDADALRQFDPALSRDYTRGVLFTANGHTVDPQGLVARLAEAFQRRGGTLHATRALGFALDGARLRAIRTEAGELPADAAVVAAGAYSKRLAAALGDDVPLETERGYHLMIRDPEVAPRVPTNDAEGKFVVTPMASGLRFAGTVELAGLKAAPDWRRAHMLLTQGRRLFPGLAAHYSPARLSVWMGHRPSLPDSLPVLGPSRRSPDVLYAFGHGHVGMTGAPMTGRVIAALVAGRPAGLDLAPFRPGRFA